MARLRRPGGETGAVAVIVALLSVVLVSICAFTIDFGMSYASTRQLQTASDAAVLAGAAAYKDASGTCSVLAADALLRTNADGDANSLRNQNRDASTGSITSVGCTADGLGLKVTYSSNGRTPSFLGPIFGHSGDYDTTRTATAEVRVPDGLSARPYALCASQLPAVIPSTVFQMTLPATGSVLCPGADAGGNWWSIDCPADGNNSTSGLGDATANGCSTPISIVSGQGTLTGAALRNYLINECPNRSDSCLSANPGNLRGTPIVNAWDTLVDAHQVIVLPVFCGVPPCDQSAVSPDNGNGTIYPVQALIAVTVCGYHWGPKEYDAGMTGPCGGLVNNPLGLRSSTGGSGDNYLLMKVERLQVSGKSDDSECKIGDPVCDKGLRKVQLTK